MIPCRPYETLRNTANPTTRCEPYLLSPLQVGHLGPLGLAVQRRSLLGDGSPAGLTWLGEVAARARSACDKGELHRSHLLVGRPVASRNPSLTLKPYINPWKP